MVNDDHMTSTTTLQSHILPILEILDIDENQDEIEGEKNPLTR